MNLRGAVEKSRISADEVEQIRKQIPEWKDIFCGTDSDTKRVLIDKIVKRIDIAKEKIVIEFKIDMKYFK